MRKVLIVAGEASGDLHAAALIRALKARDSGLHFFGLGGELMRRDGVELLYDLSSLAVAGFWEVAKRFVAFRRIYHDVLARAEKGKPDLVILVDYPGMNLRLARELKRQGCRIAYYIVPQVWAWKPGRIRKLEERVDLLLSILPFEKALFDPARLKCEFVGHPLLDAIDTAQASPGFREKYHVSPRARIIALLPGSRLVEITRHYRPMLETVKLLRSEGQDVQAVTAVRDELERSVYSMIEDTVDFHPVHLVTDRHDLLKSAAVSIVASGTATLEAALCGRPFCVVYRTGWLTYQIAKRVISLQMVGLVNIIAGERIVPEFLQGEMTVDKLSAFCHNMLTDADAASAIVSKLSDIRGKLGQRGASEQAAELIYREFWQ